MKVMYSFVFIILIIMIGHVAATDTCSDGTEIYDCSTTQPGKYCTSGPSGPMLQDYADRCPCPAGYTKVVDTQSPLGRCVSDAAGQDDTSAQDDTSSQDDTTQDNAQDNVPPAQNDTSAPATSGQDDDTNAPTSQDNGTTNDMSKMFVFKPLEAEESNVCSLGFVLLALLILTAVVV